LKRNWNGTAGIPVWYDAGDLCALADDERHLGHVVNVGTWDAFDSIHPDADGSGVRHLGTFPNIEEAKAAVEKSVSLRVWPA
jgi:hypothetical protein